MWQRKRKIPRGKPVQIPIRPPRTPYGMHKDAKSEPKRRKANVLNHSATEPPHITLTTVGKLELKVITII